MATIIPKDDRFGKRTKRNIMMITAGSVIVVHRFRFKGFGAFSQVRKVKSSGTGHSICFLSGIG